MNKIILTFSICLSLVMQETKAQILTMSNKPGQTSSRTGIETGSFVYGVFVGRTACQELMKDLNMGVNKECAKRKMGIILYQDSVTHEPTTYKTWGLGKW